MEGVCVRCVCPCVTIQLHINKVFADIYGQLAYIRYIMKCNESALPPRLPICTFFRPVKYHELTCTVSIHLEEKKTS